MRPNKTLIPLALALAACSPAAVEVPYADLGYKNGNYTLDGEPFNGVAVESHPNGTRSKSFTFKNGVHHGLSEQWTEDATRVVATHFEDGVRHGKNTYWNPDGSLQKQQLYHHGEVTSEVWHSNKPGG